MHGLSATLILGSTIATVTPTGAQVPFVVTGPGPISMELGIEAAKAALSTCRLRNSKVIVVIAENSRGLSVVLSAPQTNPDAFNVALKGIEAILEREAHTGVNPEAALPHNGAIPIFKHRDIVNVIAVAGADNETNQICAQAGLQAIANKLD